MLDTNAQKHENTFDMKTQEHKNSKVPVSKRAVVARVKRALLKDGMVLRHTRGAKAEAECGEWFITDDRGNREDDHVDLEALARKLGALAPFETMVGE
jgi:hypothetical protein